MSLGALIQRVGVDSREVRGWSASLLHCQMRRNQRMRHVTSELEGTLGTVSHSECQVTQ